MTSVSLFASATRFPASSARNVGTNTTAPTVAEISQVAKVPVEVDAETGKKLVRLMEALDDHDDVQNVYSNANISEEMVAEVGD